MFLIGQLIFSLTIIVDDSRIIDINTQRMFYARPRFS
jgi:hypothetical protein